MSLIPQKPYCVTLAHRLILPAVQGTTPVVPPPGGSCSAVGQVQGAQDRPVRLSRALSQGLQHWFCKLFEIFHPHPQAIDLPSMRG